MVKVIKTQAKEIYTKSKLPGCDWAINQYVGCQHACLYCYAKFISRWRPADYGKFGTWVEAKINAPDLIKQKYVDGWVYMSSISDPYQQIEKELKLTRQILENLDKRTKIDIQTKSDLVLRDIDLFKQFKTIKVGLTINTFEGKAKAVFEPCSPSNKQRIKALKTLKENGIKTFVFVSPLIPELIDLKQVIEDTKDYADSYWFEFINVRGAGDDFMEALKKEFPKSYEILTDSKKMAEFVKDCREIINSYNIKINGIESHTSGPIGKKKVLKTHKTAKLL